jgi:hypothetical protein
MKVYLLLRNNQQTGPHTFEELLRLQLKPHDLIWIEGKSYGWRYPAEVESLKPYLSTVDSFKNDTEHTPPKNNRTENPEKDSTKKIFVSMPVSPQANSRTDITATDPIEQKAEELRKRVQAFTPQQEEVKTNYSRNIIDAEQEYTNWIYETKNRKKSKIPGKALAVASIGVLIVLAGWWMKEQMFDQPSVVPTAAVQSKNSTEVDEIKTPDKSIAEAENTSAEEPKPKTGKVRTENQEESTADKVTMKKETAAAETISIKDEEIIDEAPISDNSHDLAETPSEAPAEKKKTLKEKLSDLFKKNKEAEEEPKPADNASIERKATKRENDDAATSAIDISDKVEIKTNKVADSWMMGVKNVKLTLHNRSNLTLNMAKIEVLYYSDQNSLLEKKIIAYANIPSKKSQSLSIPDNRLADHIDYKVLSATGIENAYANR